ncbi:MAG: SufD family Fe-S cluster assembly protein [Patescibacteria group bacterium]|nr:SufD family Fe-S cluster assembly protein [Patescibacteria group bacterium]
MKTAVRSKAKRIRVTGSRSLIDFDLAPELMIELAPGTHLRYFSALGIGQRRKRVHFRLGRNARLEAETVIVGRDARISVNHLVEHAGRQATAFNRVLGVFDGAASATVQGMIFVPLAGQGSVSRLEQRALLLAPNPEIRLLPQLQIEADDVDIHHASAASPLDETQLFYCRSRGISITSARRLLVQSFFGAALINLENIKLREEVIVAFQKKIALL